VGGQLKPKATAPQDDGSQVTACQSECWGLEQVLRLEKLCAWKFAWAIVCFRGDSRSSGFVTQRVGCVEAIALQCILRFQYLGTLDFAPFEVVDSAPRTLGLFRSALGLCMQASLR
jgi:hypothetical protein